MDRIPPHVPDEAVAPAAAAPSVVMAPIEGVIDAEPDAQRVLDVDAVDTASTPQVLSPTSPGGATPWGFDPPPYQPPAIDDAVVVSEPAPPLPPVVSVPPPSRTAPLFGPVGRRRSMVAMALLSAVTFGVYALAWHRRVNREMEEFDPKLHARPVRSAVAVGVPWLVGLLASVVGAIIVLTDHFAVHLPVDPHVTLTQAYLLLGGVAVIPYLVLLVPFSLVAVVMTLERLRSVEEHVGLTADRQVRAVGTSLLLLIPVVGGLALVAVQQRRLNAVWASMTPSGRLQH